MASLEPEILLIDEILAVGDMEFQKKCNNRLIEFRKQGVTIIFVSHTMGNIEKLCDRVLWIEEHQVKMCGPPAEVVRAYEQEQ